MTATACPVCAKPSVERFAPFCSRRCADIDLGRWLKGRYVIPGSEGHAPETPNPDAVGDGDDEDPS